jgi:hypothetical protein
MLYLFNKYPYWIYQTCCIISMFLSSKCRLFHNAKLFGFCITHILNTGCANILKKSVAKRLNNNVHSLSTFKTPVENVRRIMKHFLCSQNHLQHNAIYCIFSLMAVIWSDYVFSSESFVSNSVDKWVNRSEEHTSELQSPK